MKEALGLVEVKGLSTAILVADAMAKTANVNIIGIENTKGSGYMAIKISGDVGAVNAAVTAGKHIAIDNNAFVAAKVIPRPSNNVGSAFCQPKKKEEDTSIAEENNISEECSATEQSNIEKIDTAEDSNISEANNNLEDSVIIAEESIVEAVEESEDKQEEIISQGEDVVVESEETTIQSQEEISQQDQSDTEIPQSQSGEKKTRRTSSRKKEK